MVFSREAAPKTRKEFMHWCKKQTEWSEDHDYSDPAVTSADLRNWYMEMIENFPPMNGPFSNEEDDSSYVTEYNVGFEVIYMAFAWSVEKEAYSAVIKLAEKHGVGFFNVSHDNGEILFPKDGKLISINDLNKTSTKTDQVQESKSWWKKMFGRT